MSGVPVARRTLRELAQTHGGNVRGEDSAFVERVVPVAVAGRGDLAPVLATRWIGEALRARERGAMLLVDASIASDSKLRAIDAWVHPSATWAFAELLDGATIDPSPVVVGVNSKIASSVVFGPRVVVGRNVTIGEGCVIGHPGFGWAIEAGGRVRHVPQLGGVVIEDDVHIGPLSTVDAGTLAPTRIRRGAKLDAHVHIGHNADVGESCILAAQVGLAGSVVLGRGVLVGGQAGFADHVVVGDGARVAAKSGVIGDVPKGAVVAGYPAVARARWLRGLAHLYRDLSKKGS